MQSDNNLVMYDLTGEPIWASGTAGVGMRPSYLKNDCGTLKIVDNAGTTIWSKTKSSSQSTPLRLVL
jgi:hypothetical protein